MVHWWWCFFSNSSPRPQTPNLSPQLKQPVVRGPFNWEEIDSRIFGQQRLLWDDGLWGGGSVLGLSTVEGCLWWSWGLPSLSAQSAQRSPLAALVARGHPCCNGPPGGTGDSSPTSGSNSPVDLTCTCLATSLPRGLSQTLSCLAHPLKMSFNASYYFSVLYSASMQVGPYLSP